MSEVNFPPEVGGDGSTYTDDANPQTGMGNGGFRTRLMPMLEQVVAVAQWIRQRALDVLGLAEDAAADAQRAEEAANAAAESFTEFGKRYLGEKEADPETDNSGQPLDIGALYWNTELKQMRVWDGQAWDASYLPASGYARLTENVFTGPQHMARDPVEPMEPVTNRMIGAPNGIAALDENGMVVAGSIPPVFETGQIVYRATSPGEGFVPADGAVYLRSTYPDLAMAVGAIANGATSWTSRGSIFGGTSISALGYFNGLFLAVGAGARISTSTDGINWTSRNSGVANVLFLSVAYGNGMFVIVGDGGRILTSPDGFTWTARTSGAGSTTLRTVCFGNGQFFVGGAGGLILTSADGITWASRSIGVAKDIYAMAFHNGVFVAVGAQALLATSPDGIAWSQVWTGLPNTDTLTAVAFGNGRWVAAGSGGNVLVSDDAVSWALHSVALPWAATYSLSYGGGLYLAGGPNGYVATSTDGVAWASQTSAIVANTNIAASAYGNGLFVMGSGTGIVMTAPAYTYNPATEFAVPSLPNYSGSKPYVRT